MAGDKKKFQQNDLATLVCRNESFEHATKQVLRGENSDSVTYNKNKLSDNRSIRDCLEKKERNSDLDNSHEGVLIGPKKNASNHAGERGVWHANILSVHTNTSNASNENAVDSDMSEGFNLNPNPNYVDQNTRSVSMSDGKKDDAERLKMLHTTPSNCNQSQHSIIQQDDSHVTFSVIDPATVNDAEPVSSSALIHQSDKVNESIYPTEMLDKKVIEKKELLPTVTSKSAFHSSSRRDETYNSPRECDQIDLKGCNNISDSKPPMVSYVQNLKMRSLLIRASSSGGSNCSTASDGTNQNELELEVHATESIQNHSNDSTCDTNMSFDTLADDMVIKYNKRNLQNEPLHFNYLEDHDQKKIMRATVTSTLSIRMQKVQRKIFGMLCLVVLLALMASFLVLFVTHQTAENEKEMDRDALPSIENDTIKPTFPGDLSPSSTPISQELERRQRILEVLIPISGVDVLEDPTSYQYTALQWVFQTDPMRLDVTSTAQLIQRYILAVFYYATGGENWARCGGDRGASENMEEVVCTDENGVIVTNSKGETRYNFLSGVSECKWYGIKCSGQHVALLSLRDNNLVGVIPKELVHFSYLKYLVLDRNMLTGKIPKSLFSTQTDGTDQISLQMMKGLYLSNNELSGEIPTTLGQLRKLESLLLRGNKLQGSIPPELFFGSPGRDMPQTTTCQLKSVDISGNTIVGQIPKTMFSCNNLENVNMMDNQIDGYLIGEDFVSLKKLQVLELGKNQITGNLPPEMFFPGSQLKFLDLRNNSLIGEVPKEVSNLVLLGKLDIAYNGFTGSMPNEICALREEKLASLSSDCESGASNGVMNGLTEVTEFAKIECSCCTECSSGV